MLIDEWYTVAYKLTEDEALSILQTHRHFWKNFDRFFGILYPLSNKIYVHQGFLNMFRENLEEWIPAITASIFMISFTDKEPNILESLVGLLPKYIMLRDVIINHRAPFVKCFQMLLAHGYTVEEMHDIVLRSYTWKDVELIQWIVDQEMENQCPPDPLLTDCIVKRNITWIKKHYQHPLMDLCVLDELIAENNFLPSTIKKED